MELLNVCNAQFTLSEIKTLATHWH